MHTIIRVFTLLCLITQSLCSNICPDKKFLNSLAKRSSLFAATQCTAAGTYAKGDRANSNYPRYDHFSLAANTLFPEDGLATLIECSISSSVSVARLSNSYAHQSCNVGNRCIIQQTCDLTQQQKCWLALNDTNTFNSRACNTPALRVCWEHTNIWSKYQECLVNISTYINISASKKSVSLPPRCSLQEATKNVLYRNIGSCVASTLRPGQGCAMVCGNVFNPGLQNLKCDWSGHLLNLGCRAIFTVEESSSIGSARVAWGLVCFLSSALVVALLYILGVRWAWKTPDWYAFDRITLSRASDDIYGENDL